jgi:hypothetical protein
VVTIEKKNLLEEDVRELDEMRSREERKYK